MSTWFRNGEVRQLPRGLQNHGISKYFFEKNVRKGLLLFQTCFKSTKIACLKISLKFGLKYTSIYFRLAYRKYWKKNISWELPAWRDRVIVACWLADLKQCGLNAHYTVWYDYDRLTQSRDLDEHWMWHSQREWLRHDTGWQTGHSSMFINYY